MARRCRPQIHFEVVTLFPSMFEGPMDESILGRAQTAGILKVTVHHLRRWAEDQKHMRVDDRPFGGGPGMVIQAEPVYRAIKSLGGLKKSPGRPWVVYLSPQGRGLTQNRVKALSKKKHVILVCGHYEGIDERVLKYMDEEISIGDYVLTGGEIPAMVVIDAVARQIPGVVGDPESVENESFSSHLLDFPHYTRPAVWRGMKVPVVLMSGHHEKIRSWRTQESLGRTMERRPDLLRKQIKKKESKKALEE